MNKLEMECLCINFNKNSNILFLFNFQTWNSKIVYIYISIYILRNEYSKESKREFIYKRRRWKMKKIRWKSITGV